MGNLIAERMAIARDIRQIYRRILEGEEGLDHCLQLLEGHYAALGGEPALPRKRVEGEIAAWKEEHNWKVHDILARARRAHKKNMEEARKHEAKLRRRRKQQEEEEKLRAANAAAAERARKAYINVDPTKMTWGIDCSGMLLEHSLVLPETKVVQLFEEHDINWDLLWNMPFVVRDPHDPERPMTELQSKIMKFVGHVGAPLEIVANHIGLDRGTTRFLLFNLERQGFLWRDGQEWVVRDV